MAYKNSAGLCLPGCGAGIPGYQLRFSSHSILKLPYASLLLMVQGYQKRVIEHHHLWILGSGSAVKIYHFHTCPQGRKPTRTKNGVLMFGTQQNSQKGSRNHAQIGQNRTQDPNVSFPSLRASPRVPPRWKNGTPSCQNRSTRPRK